MPPSVADNFLMLKPRSGGRTRNRSIESLVAAY